MKYEEIYFKDHATGADLNEGLAWWFDLYTYQRPHQALGNRTPYEVFTGLDRRHQQTCSQPRPHRSRLPDGSL